MVLHMNEVIQNILNRRSWRSYEEKQIKEEELEQIIRCGLWAPSAMNQQSWHFTVVQDKETIQRIRKGCQEMMETDRDMFYGAPTLVIVTGKQDTVKNIPKRERGFLALSGIATGASWSPSFFPMWSFMKRSPEKPSSACSSSWAGRC